MIRRLLSAPISLLLLPVRLLRALAAMRFSTVLAVGTGAAAAFTAARRLMTNEDVVDGLPEGLQRPAANAQGFLVRWRGRLTQAITEANAEETVAQEELHLEFLRKTGRSSD